MKPVIQIQDLHKTFGKNEVLKGINLEIGEGEVIALIGASGSGKSTLLRCVNRLETPTSGTIAVEPEDAVEGGKAGTANTVEGGLVASSFLGAVASLEMDCFGSRIVVERHRPKPGDLPAPGSRFAFALPPEAILLFDPESGARLRAAPGPGEAR